MGQITYLYMVKKITTYPKTNKKQKRIFREKKYTFLKNHNIKNSIQIYKLTKKNKNCKMFNASIREAKRAREEQGVQIELPGLSAYLASDGYHKRRRTQLPDFEGLANPIKVEHSVSGEPCGWPQAPSCRCMLRGETENSVFDLLRLRLQQTSEHFGVPFSETLCAICGKTWGLYYHIRLPEGTIVEKLIKSGCSRWTDHWWLLSPRSARLRSWILFAEQEENRRISGICGKENAAPEDAVAAFSLGRMWRGPDRTSKAVAEPKSVSE